MKKEWKVIEWFEDCYEISNFWEIKSLSRLVHVGNNNFRKIKEKIKKLDFSKYWYSQIQRHDWSCTHFDVAKLVYETFVWKASNFVKYKDWNKKNCRLDNLHINNS